VHSCALQTLPQCCLGPRQCHDSYGYRAHAADQLQWCSADRARLARKCNLSRCRYRSALARGFVIRQDLAPIIAEKVAAATHCRSNSPVRSHRAPGSCVRAVLRHSDRFIPDSYGLLVLMFSNIRHLRRPSTSGNGHGRTSVAKPTPCMIEESKKTHMGRRPRKSSPSSAVPVELSPF